MRRLMMIAAAVICLAGCRREPPLHLYEEAEVMSELPMVELALDVYWDYEMEFGLQYDWRSEWHFPWSDETDGPIGYTEPTLFQLRRYYTGSVPYAPHTTTYANVITGMRFIDKYHWGFWDFLVWNDIITADGVQSIIIDEQTSLDYVTAFTNQTMSTARYNAPQYTRSFYQPEELFSAYSQGEEINEQLDGFTFDAERNIWVKQLNMTLTPVTYIYLTQVILHNNKGRITSVDGQSNLSGMARTVVLNTKVTGEDAITVSYNVVKRNNCDYPHADGTIEKVDIIGGRVLTFGICNNNPDKITRIEQVNDNKHHYMDVNVQFNNGMDSTIVFDVTDQVRRRYKGGVITVELDVDTVPIPQRSGGSGFNAVVKDFEEVTHEIEM